MPGFETRTHYEWVVETLDENGVDIIDVAHSDRFPTTVELNEQVAITRATGCEELGIVDRSYAYVENGKLETTFDDGKRVPNRFHVELKNARGQQ
jgi:hypothetical protein